MHFFDRSFIDLSKISSRNSWSKRKILFNFTISDLIFFMFNLATCLPKSKSTICISPVHETLITFTIFLSKKNHPRLSSTPIDVSGIVAKQPRLSLFDNHEPRFQNQQVVDVGSLFPIFQDCLLKWR